MRAKKPGRDLIGFEAFGGLEQKESSVRVSSYIRLTYDLAWRDIHNRYAGTALGLSWNLVGPILQALVPAVVFSFLMKGKLGSGYGDVPFALFYFTGYAVWALMAETLSRSSGIVRENASLITKTTLPKSVFPWVALAAALPNHAVLLCINLVLCIWWNGGVGVAILLLPVYFVCAVLFIAGMARLIAAVSVFVLDLPQLLPSFINAWFFMTPVLYPPTLVAQNAPDWVKLILLRLNPMSHLVDGYRMCFLSQSPDVPAVSLAALMVGCGVTYYVGARCYARLENSFADVL
jgi:ABC-type polysaccharide/polyol phosphate export permease